LDELNEDEKILNVNFVTEDESIYYSITCKNTDKMNKIIKLFYLKYPEYKNFSNKFTFKGEYEWWRKKKNAAMHENTKRFIDECLFIMMKENSSRLLSSEKLKQIYNKYNQ
jgi:hypothetical protein